jgi:HAD superfamily hydrolase (TIGR01509 family)
MRPELVIFDCDGVLIDSETIASRVVSRNLTALGWPMTTEAAMANFLGMSIVDMEPLIAARLGGLPEHWRRDIGQELLLAVGSEVTLIPHARETLEAVTAMGIAWRIASNSSDAEMQVKFAHTGIADLTEGLTFSAGAIIAQGGRAKPAPDVFLAAAAAAQALPARCLVLEDSPLGVTGAVAAGMTCLGFAPNSKAAQLTAAGAAAIVHSLDQFLAYLESLSR